MAKKSKTDAPEGEDAKKGGGMMKLIVIALVVVAITGGGAFYAFSSGMIGNSAEAATAEAAPRQLSYHAFERAFTFNEHKGPRLIQVNISMSAESVEPIADRVDPHEPALRSALLTAMMDVDRNTLNDPKQRTELRGRLKEVMNRELTARTGTGGIEEVFFTDVIIQ